MGVHRRGDDALIRSLFRFCLFHFAGLDVNIVDIRLREGWWRHATGHAQRQKRYPEERRGSDFRREEKSQVPGSTHGKLPIQAR